MIDLYPSADAFIEANPSNYQKVGRIRFSLVVIHVTDGHGSAYPVAKMWQQPNHGSSAHFVIGQSGTVIQCVRISDSAWHAHDLNRLSVGIEHSARSPGELGPNDPGLALTEAQYNASAKLIAWLCSQAGIEISRDTVKGHAEVDTKTTHTDCPTGAGFDLDKLVGLAKALVTTP